MMRRSLFSSALLLAALGGCSPESSEGARTADPGVAAGTQCAPNNLTRQCVCATGSPGRQTCQAGVFSACACSARPTAAAGSGAPSPANPGATSPGGDPLENRSTVRFDWARTTPSGGSCEAGRYQGTFDGIYGPSIIVVADLKVIPVFPVELPDNPGLAFDLNREGSGEIFTVSNGVMSGNALGAFPFTAEVVGKLNCETSKFDAKLVNGSYFIGPLEYKFEGPITADYDKLTHSMINGAWMVTEPEYPSAGGSGTWTVKWVHN